MISAIYSDSDPFPQQLRLSVYSRTVLECVSCSIKAYHKPRVAIPACKWENTFTVILTQLCALLRGFSDTGQKSEPSVQSA